MADFETFSKIPRLYRECVITEKLDGTNAQLVIPEDDGPMQIGSRNRWITPAADNYGFARWATEHEAALRKTLGPGRHYGEWWGSGIQRRYGQTEKRFSLFNSYRWSFLGDYEFKMSAFQSCRLPFEISCVPVLYRGKFTDAAVRNCLELLRTKGSVAAPGFMNPEGICVYHEASKQYFKVTLGNDGHKDEQVTKAADAADYDADFYSAAA